MLQYRAEYLVKKPVVKTKAKPVSIALTAKALAKQAAQHAATQELDMLMALQGAASRASGLTTVVSDDRHFPVLPEDDALAHIGMGDQCPTMADNDTKAMLRHLNPSKQGSRFAGPNYYFDGQGHKIRLSGYATFSGR